MSNYSELFPTLGKNVIINGDMRINQRGGAGTTNGSFAVDRWGCFINGTMGFQSTQTSDSPEGFSYSHRVDVTTAQTTLGSSDYFNITQKIEGINYTRFIGQRATLSFWVKSNKTGPFSVSFGNSGVDRSYVVECSISQSDTWEKKSVILDFDYTGGTWNLGSGVGLLVYFNLASGSTYQTSSLGQWLSENKFASSGGGNWMDNTSNYFSLTGVQLESGGAPTEFEFLDTALSLMQCQRYYETGNQTPNIWSGVVQNGYSYYLGITYKVRKRAVASISATPAGNLNNSGVNSNDVDGFRMQFGASAASGSSFIVYSWVADAEL